MVSDDDELLLEVDDDLLLPAGLLEEVVASLQLLIL